jgi:hypothetical protein
MDLLVHLWRIDFRDDLARPDTIPDVHEAALQVAVGARQDRRFGQRLHGPGQLDLVPVLPAADADDGQTRSPRSCASASARSVASRC